MSRIVTFSDFKEAFDQLGDESLMRPGKEGSPLYELTRFSRENPGKYQEYRKRMHDENYYQHNQSVMDKEFW